MPIPLLLAWFIGLGIGLPSASPAADASHVWASVLGLAIGMAGASMLLSIVTLRLSKGWGWADPRCRRVYTMGLRLLDLAGLIGYAWLVHRAGWLLFVRDEFGSIPFAREGAILAPYLGIQLLSWVGTWPVDRVLISHESGAVHESISSAILRRLRQSWGLVLPIGLLLVFTQFVLESLAPGQGGLPLVQFTTAASLALLVLLAAPCLIRLGWSTRPLQDGSLRGRLLELANRIRFRVGSIRVWDTRKHSANAAITGILPLYRDVLLTDLLIAGLDEPAVEAVFAHEVGHAKHYHLADLALFFAGSLAITVLAGRVMERYGPSLWITESWTADLAVISVFGIYVGVLLGMLSRRFERQADLFGCRVLSRLEDELTDRPLPESKPRPHFDAKRQIPTVAAIERFSETLRSVARLNGLDLERRSWRHGSVADRIRFLEQVVSRSGTLRRFESSLFRLRLLLGTMSAAACFAVLWLSWPA